MRNVLVCAYNGLDNRPRNALAAAGMVHRRKARVLQHRLNAAPVPKGRSYACPSDDGSSFFVVFAFRKGKDQQIEVARTGCRWAYNGDRTVSTTPRVQRQLAHISHD